MNSSTPLETPGHIAKQLRVELNDFTIKQTFGLLQATADTTTSQDDVRRAHGIVRMLEQILNETAELASRIDKERIDVHIHDKESFSEINKMLFEARAKINEKLTEQMNEAFLDNDLGRYKTLTKISVFIDNAVICAVDEINDR